MAQLHQDLESERLKRQTLQLLVFQLRKDVLLLQTFLASQNTGASQKLFTIDPTSASNLGTHELLQTSTPRPARMGNSDPPTSTALLSSYDKRPLSRELTLTVSKKVGIDQLKNPY